MTLTSSFSLLFLWSLASPLMSSPDEPSHVVFAAAVARGEIVADNSDHPEYAIRHVPAFVGQAGALACFAFDPTRTADCQDSVVIADPDVLQPSLTTSTLNSPVYFFLTGLPTLVASGDLALYLMRVVSSLLCAFLLAIAASALAQLQRSSFSLAALAIAVTPMVLFLGGSVNPNGVEVCAAAAVFCCLVLAGRRDNPPSRLLAERLIMLVVAVFFLVNTRSLSLAWLLFAVLLALLLAERGAVRALFSRRPTWIAFVAATIVVVAATVWFVSLVRLEPTEGTAVGTDVAPADAFIRMLLLSPLLAAGWVGIFGWLDTSLPQPLYFIYAGVSAAFVALGLWFGRVRERVAIVIAGLGIVLLPAIAQAALISDWGWVWQGRYHLALFVVLLVAAGVIIDASRAGEPRRWHRVFLGASLALALAVHVAAFVVALHRYASGQGTSLLLVFSDPQWQPPLGVVAIVIAFVIAAVGASWLVWRGSRPYSTLAPVAADQ